MKTYTEEDVYTTEYQNHKALHRSVRSWEDREGICNYICPTCGGTLNYKQYLGIWEIRIDFDCPQCGFGVEDFEVL